MYYMNSTIKCNITLNKDSLETFHTVITVYCKCKDLDSSKQVENFNNIDVFLRHSVENVYLEDIIECPATLEKLAKYIWDNIINCYKVKISMSGNYEVIFEEDVE